MRITCTRRTARPTRRRCGRWGGITLRRELCICLDSAWKLFGLKGSVTIGTFPLLFLCFWESLGMRRMDASQRFDSRLMIISDGVGRSSREKQEKPSREFLCPVDKMLLDSFDNDLCAAHC